MCELQMFYKTNCPGPWTWNMWSIPLNLQPELIFNSLIPEMEINVNVLFLKFELNIK